MTGASLYVSSLKTLQDFFWRYSANLAQWNGLTLLICQKSVPAGKKVILFFQRWCLIMQRCFTTCTQCWGISKTAHHRILHSLEVVKCAKHWKIDWGPLKKTLGQSVWDCGGPLYIFQWLTKKIEDAWGLTLVLEVWHLHEVTTAKSLCWRTKWPNGSLLKLPFSHLRHQNWSRLHAISHPSSVHTN